MSLVTTASVVMSRAGMTPQSSSRRPTSYRDRSLVSYRHWLHATTDTPRWMSRVRLGSRSRRT